MWKVKKSKIHNSGVFASEDIKKGTRIIEYIGKKVTKAQGDKISEKRLNKYLHSKKEGSVYIFELNKKYDIDGSPKYNKARYINHSCSPNCEVDVIRGHIWISAIKNIKKNDELTYDYGYSFDKDDYKDHVCRCESKNCIGYIISSDEWYKYKSYKRKLEKK
tara:strand:- start:604 stop:1089 length:486 start_codon:yes stop_codon:yes gene_type:complete